jgi:hypothetical protein
MRDGILHAVVALTARTLSALLRWQLFSRNPYDKSRDR